MSFNFLFSQFGSLREATFGFLGCDEWLIKLTENLELRPIYMLQENDKITDDQFDKHGCIINSPDETMSHPLIGIGISEIADLILQVSNKKPDSRTKPVVAALRGVGGGKTRILEELRRSFMKKNDQTLPVAITFGNETEYNGKDYEVEFRVSEAISQAISLIARILYSVYELKEFGDILLRIKDCGPPPQFATVGKLIESCVRHVVLKIRSVGNMPINHFILLIDESMKLIETDKSSSAIYNKVRAALLNKRILEDLNVAVVMTSLALESINITDSSRTVETLFLPAYLNATSVVDDWWLNYNGRHIIVDHETDIDIGASSIHKSTQAYGLNLLYLTASMLGAQPRVCEFAKKYIDKNLFQDDPNSPVLHVNGSFLYKLLDFVNDMYKQMYRGYFNAFQMLTPQLMMSLIFGEKISVTSEVLKLIRTSVFTNSLSIDDHIIIPEASLLSLLLVATDEQNKKSPNRRLVYKPLVDLYSSYRTYLEGKSKVSIAALLEACLYNWLRIRLAALIDNGMKSVSMMQLLSLQEFFSESATEDNSAIDIDLIPLPKRFIDIKEFQLPNIRETKNAQNFLDDAYLSDFSPLRLICPGPTQPFDVGIVYRGVNTNDINVIFLEAKSKSESLATNRNSSRNDNISTNESNQHIEVQEIMSTLLWNYGNKPGKKPIEESEMKRGIAKYVYIYMMTDPAQPSQIHPETQTICMGREEVKQYFGILWNFYVTARATRP